MKSKSSDPLIFTMNKISYYLADDLQVVFIRIEEWAHKMGYRVNTIKPIIWHKGRPRWHWDIFDKPHGQCDHEAQRQKALRWMKL